MKKLSAFILLVIMVNSLLCGCHMLFPVEGKYSSYNNFEQYKRDFEIIADVVMKHGEDEYSIDIIKRELRYFTGKGNDYSYKTVTLSGEEKESLYNIVSNSHQQGMKRIIVRDDCVCFTEGDRHLGVIYTQGDIESAIYKLVGHQSDRLNFLHNELCEDWYTIYY